jgi:hypothetical protein
MDNAFSLKKKKNLYQFSLHVYGKKVAVMPQGHYETHIYNYADAVLTTKSLESDVYIYIYIYIYITQFSQLYNNDYHNLKFHLLLSNNIMCIMTFE